MCVDRRYLAAELKLGPRHIGARTDGGLQILLPQSDTPTLSGIYDEDGGDAEEIFVEWDRSYYEIGLEVSPLNPSFIGGVPMSLRTLRRPPGLYSPGYLRRLLIRYRELLRLMLGEMIF